MYFKPHDTLLEKEKLIETRTKFWNKLYSLHPFPLTFWEPNPFCGPKCIHLCSRANIRVLEFIQYSFAVWGKDFSPWTLLMLWCLWKWNVKSWLGLGGNNKRTTTSTTITALGWRASEQRQRQTDGRTTKKGNVNKGKVYVFISRWIWS